MSNCGNKFNKVLPLKIKVILINLANIGNSFGAKWESKTKEAPDEGEVVDDDDKGIQDLCNFVTSEGSLWSSSGPNQEARETESSSNKRALHGAGHEDVHEGTSDKE